MGKKYECEICGKHFWNKKKYLGHLGWHRKNELKLRKEILPPITQPTPQTKPQLNDGEMIAHLEEEMKKIKVEMEKIEELLSKIVEILTFKGIEIK